VTTATELIQSALRLANILGEGQTASADQASTALDALNDILGQLSLDSMSLYATDNNTVATVANQGTYTIGTGGDWAVERPTSINSAYVIYQGVSYRVTEINQDEYNEQVTLKSLQGSYIPRYFKYLNTFPLGTLTLWPSPAQVLSFVFSCDRVLTEIPTLGTTLVLPPGYRPMLRSALAVSQCIEYGLPISASLQRMATDSLANVKRGNHIPVVAEYDPALLSAPAGLASFLAGY
jgi:hypothetical protein